MKQLIFLKGSRPLSIDFRVSPTPVKKESLAKNNPEKVRVELVIKALSLGEDPVKACRPLNWKEFESLSVKLFQLNGYDTIEGFRFNCDRSRFQIDVLALKTNTIICVDCKHWMFPNWSSRIKQASKAQSRRVKALSENIELLYNKLSLKRLKKIFMIPIMLTLDDPGFTIIEDVLIVPILKMSDFLYRLPYPPDSRFKYYVSEPCP